MKFKIVINKEEIPKIQMSPLRIFEEEIPFDADKLVELIRNKGFEKDILISALDSKWEKTLKSNKMPFKNTDFIYAVPVNVDSDDYDLCEELEELSFIQKYLNDDPARVLYIFEGKLFHQPKLTGKEFEKVNGTSFSDYEEATSFYCERPYQFKIKNNSRNGLIAIIHFHDDIFSISKKKAFNYSLR
jgi:hypothetical protein